MSKIVQQISNTPLAIQMPKEGQALIIELFCLLIFALASHHFAQAIERQSNAPRITYLSPQLMAFLQRTDGCRKIALGADCPPQAEQRQSQTPLILSLPKECHAL